MRDLPWLPPAPDDFAARRLDCMALREDVGLAVQSLAGFRQTSLQALTFRRMLSRLQAGGSDLAPLSPLKLAIVSNATMSFVADYIPAAAARHGVAVTLVEAEFDVAMQEALDPASTVNTSGADAVLLAVDHRWLGLNLSPIDDGDQVGLAIDRLLGIARRFQGNGLAPILPLMATPAASLFGSYDRRTGVALASKIERVNQSVLDFVRDEGGYVFDVAAIARAVGVAEWFDPVVWNGQKQPFAPAFNALYADRLGALLGAIRGKARKCLVLDLDNTLWGGAIGDEGLAGIVLGNGSAAGEAFLAVQAVALALKERGVVLAVCSKNDDEVARSAFREHPEMLLKESDIAVFQANWTDKATNLEAIAEALSIGLDALVLLDDNPAERAQVRAALPMVAVPELPNDAAYFPTTLLSAGYFEAASFGEDDLIRARSYRDNGRRAEVMAKARDLGDYLSSLDMVLRCGPFDASNRSRVTQLINKTNQFNLLTRRLTESEVAAMEADPDVVTLQARLSDRFGDMGLIGVVTCAIEGQGATLTDWLMSCRVLGRKVEEAMYDALITALSARGVSTLEASYLPTKKNGMVSTHFDRLGLELVDNKADGSRHYRARIDDYVAPSLPMKLEIG
ncbi:MAG: HAD-IIIC family phosphatase [Janthinobacterium lividum]